MAYREVASLNEFRSFFGLEPHKTFKDVNPDVKIQNALENLYDSPDMIEMYPGIFIEELEKKKDTKSYGVGFPATAGRGVLSDAVTLVRSDRFYTIVSRVKIRSMHPFGIEQSANTHRITRQQPLPIGVSARQHLTTTRKSHSPTHFACRWA